VLSEQYHPNFSITYSVYDEDPYPAMVDGKFPDTDYGHRLCGDRSRAFRGDIEDHGEGHSGRNRVRVRYPVQCGITRGQARPVNMNESVTDRYQALGLETSKSISGRGLTIALGILDLFLIRVFFRFEFFSPVVAGTKGYHYLSNQLHNSRQRADLPPRGR